MPRDFENFDELAKADVLLDGNDIGAWHHYSFDPRFAQAENVLKHRGFFRRETRLPRLSSQNEFKVGPRRRRSPTKERTRHARKPIFRLFGRRRRHDGERMPLAVAWFCAGWRLRHGAPSAMA